MSSPPPIDPSRKRGAEAGNGVLTKRLKESEAEESAEEKAKRLLHNDLAGVLMSFLDIKDLWKFVFLRKDMLRFLTYRHVVRAGLMYNRNTKTTIDRIVENIDKIFVPSPLRLLQLVNGKRCERCNHRRVHHVLHKSGLFLCYSNTFVGCGNKSLVCHMEWGHEHPPFLEHVVYNYIPANRHDLFDNLGAEGRNGPLLTDSDVKSVGYNEEKVQQLLVQRQGMDPNRAHAATIKELADAYRTQALRREQERESLKQAKIAKAIENKKKKIQSMVASLSRRWEGKPWKDIALDHTFADNEGWRHRNKQPLLTFKMEPLQRHMQPFIVAPSKVTNAKLAEIAGEIDETLSIIYKLDLHNLSFFSDDDPLEKIWKDSILLATSTEERVRALADSLVREIRKDDELVKVQELVLAESESIQTKCTDELFDQLLERHLFDTFQTRPGVSRGIIISADIPKNRQILAESLAICLWDHERYQEPRERYRHCCKTFPNLFQSTLDYLSRYSLDEDPSEEINHIPGIITTGFSMDEKIFELLLERKFAAVRARALWLQQRGR